MSCNFGDIKRLMVKEIFNDNYSFPNIFQGISKKGIFIWKKGIKCDFILKQLPPNWNKNEE